MQSIRNRKWSDRGKYIYPYTILCCWVSRQTQNYSHRIYTFDINLYLIFFFSFQFKVLYFVSIEMSTIDRSNDRECSTFPMFQLNLREEEEKKTKGKKSPTKNTLLMVKIALPSLCKMHFFSTLRIFNPYLRPKKKLWQNSGQKKIYRQLSGCDYNNFNSISKRQSRPNLATKSTKIKIHWNWIVRELHWHCKPIDF